VKDGGKIWEQEENKKYKLKEKKKKDGIFAWRLKMYNLVILDYEISRIALIFFTNDSTIG